MRPSINKLVGLFAATVSVGEPVYEFGSFQVPGQEAIADLRPFFGDRRYVGSDMREGRGVDVVLDLHDLALRERSVGAAIMIDTLEHVEYPHRALEEVHRVLDEGGIVFMTSVMRFPIHEHPYDYWRFTPEAFLSVLGPFAFRWADFAGEPELPHTVVGVGAKVAPEPAAWASWERAFAEWKAWARAETWPEWLTPHPVGVPVNPGEGVAPAVDLRREVRERVKRRLPGPATAAIRRARGAIGRRGR